MVCRRLHGLSHTRGAAIRSFLGLSVSVPGTPVTPISTDLFHYADSSGDASQITDGLRTTAPIEAFQFLDGSWGGLTANAGITLAQDYPACEAAGADGFRRHGAMLKQDVEIIGDASSVTQGLDELAGQTSGVSNSTYAAIYAAAKNSSPTFLGTNVVLAAQGAENSIIKVRRNDVISFDAQDNEWSNSEILEEIMVFSAVNTLPFDDAARPPMLGTMSGPLLRYSDIDWTRVRSDITFPTAVAMGRTVEESKEFLRNPPLVFCTEGEKRRSLCVGEGYAQRIIKYDLVPAMYHMVNPATSEEDKRILAGRFFAHVHDVLGAKSLNRIQNGGAGQIFIDLFKLCVVAALCPGRTDILTAAQNEYSNLNDQCHWYEADENGNTVSFQKTQNPGASDLNQLPGLPDFVGHPQWLSGSVWLDDAPDDDKDYSTTARYRDLSTNATLTGVTALAMIRGAIEALWGSASTFDKTNDKFSTLALVEQSAIKFGNSLANTASINRVETWVQDLYALVRPDLLANSTSIPAVVQPPFHLCEELGASDLGLVAETATGITYDYAAMSDDGVTVWSGSEYPLTGKEGRLSQDGIQWGASTVLSNSGAIAFTGTRFFSERRAIDDNGTDIWCPWSLITPLQEGTGAPWRSKFTGGTIPTGAPVNVEAPKIYAHTYAEKTASGQDTYPLLSEITTARPADKVILVAGVGVWADGIDMTATEINWFVRENGGARSAITALVSNTFDSDLDHTLDATAHLTTPTIARQIQTEVIADDGNGNTTTVTSGWIDMPLATAITEPLTTDEARFEPTAINGGTIVHDGSGAYRCTPSLSETFSGGSIKIDGLVIGQAYTLDVAVSALSTDDRVTAVAGTTAGDSSFGSSSNILQGTTAGTLAIPEFTATTSSAWVSVRSRFVSAPGAFHDIDQITLTPQFPAAPSSDAVIVQEKAAHSGAANVTSLAPQFDATPTSGNLLLAALVVDKAAQTNTMPAGWDSVGTINNPGECQIEVFEKISDGTETGAITASWASAATGVINLLELSGVSSVVEVASAVGGSVTSLALNSNTSAAVGSMALAWVGNDSKGGAPAPYSATGGFTVALVPLTGSQGNGLPIFLQAQKKMTATETPATVLGHAGGNSDLAAIMVLVS